MLQPLEDGCIIEIRDLPPMSKLIIENQPDIFNQVLWLGKVVAVGEGRRLEENGTRLKPIVAVGDTVLVPALAANFAEHFNRRTTIYRERDIYAIVDDPEKITIPRDPAYE